jgi:predicted nucleotidyltransferase
MAAVTDASINIVNHFLTLLAEAHITVQKAMLFGSTVRGTATEWSDIDVAIVSSDFSGIPFRDSQMLSDFLLQVDSRIELHTFRPEDFNENNGFAGEIIKKGISIPVNN